MGMNMLVEANINTEADSRVVARLGAVLTCNLLCGSVALGIANILPRNIRDSSMGFLPTLLLLTANPHPLDLKASGQARDTSISSG